MNNNNAVSLSVLINYEHAQMEQDAGKEFTSVYDKGEIREYLNDSFIDINIIDRVTGLFVVEEDGKVIAIFVTFDEKPHKTWALYHPYIDFLGETVPYGSWALPANFISELYNPKFLELNGS